MSEHLPSGRRGQMLAIGMTVILAASLWIAIVSPLMAWYEARSATLADRQLLAERMKAIAATVPPLLRQAAMTRSAAPSGRDIALKALSDAVAAAQLQQHMQDLAQASGITFSSIETLPVEQQGGYRRISLRVTCSAPWSAFIGLLQTIEDSTPRMLIDGLDLNASPDLVHPNGVAIGADFTVIAFRPGSTP
jgi:hypothetical protein